MMNETMTRNEQWVEEHYKSAVNLTVLVCKMAAAGRSDEQIMKITRSAERDSSEIDLFGTSEHIAKIALAVWRTLP